VLVGPSQAYRPRHPEENPLYGVVAGHLETYLARQRRRDRNVPEFIEREFRAFLDCGILARGFVRVHCDTCGMDRVVPYSCKHRGFCNSCCGRRMADTAAHLVDRVFPRVPVRQWVLTFPYDLRYRLAYDARLVTHVLGIFTKTVFGSLIRRAREFGAVQSAQCGGVSFIQRFDSALRLNLHIHSLIIDGVYAAGDDDQPHFQVLPAPDDEEITRVTALLAQRIRKFLQRRGLGPESDPEESDPLVRDQPWLAGLYAGSVLGRSASGGNGGTRQGRGDQIDPLSLEAYLNPRCATVDGFSLHANVAVHAADRVRLERLARYCARPPVALERLEQLAGGRLLYRFKRAWRDGTTHIVLDPLEMIEKLAALIPAPHAHLVRYAGILAPASKWRPRIVPAAPEVEGAAVPETRTSSNECLHNTTEQKTPPATSRDVVHGRNYTWAELMKRVWALDVLECPRCQGRMRILAAIHSPDAIHKILVCLGLPSRAPPVSRAVPTTVAATE
jgi:putative transposase/transposase-like zinc-binding protein